MTNRLVPAFGAAIALAVGLASAASAAPPRPAAEYFPVGGDALDNRFYEVLIAGAPEPAACGARCFKVVVEELKPLSGARVAYDIQVSLNEDRHAFVRGECPTAEFEACAARVRDKVDAELRRLGAK